jgi:hypothetical protein
LIFKYVVLRDGTRLPLRGTVELKGKGAGAAAAALGVAFGAARAAAVTGLGYAIPAGTLFSAEVDGEHEIRAAPAAPPSQN